MLIKTQNKGVGRTVKELCWQYYLQGRRDARPGCGPPGDELRERFEKLWKEAESEDHEE